MVKNVIKGSFPMSKVLVLEGNSYVYWKNEDIRQFYDCTFFTMCNHKIIIIIIIIYLLPACFDNLSGVKTLRKEKQNNTNNTINKV